MEKKRERKGEPRQPQGKRKIPKPPKFNFMWIYAIIFALIIGFQLLFSGSDAKLISKQKFMNELLTSGDVSKVQASNKDGEIYKVDVFLKPESLKDSKYKDDIPTSSFGTNTGPHYVFNVPSFEGLEREMEEAQKDVAESEKILPNLIPQQSNDFTDFILTWMLPLGIVILIWVLLMRRLAGGSGGPGGQLFNIGKSKATLFDKESQVNITFNDVAGLEEAKQEVMEVVDFLKNPKKYTSLGGKIPKGVLLVGSPGTGKTLLAKAVAGEAQVPFFSLSGSDFVEMFVGVGASRVRDLFKQAREKAPCIIFIDEIDAIGRSRGKNQIMGGNDERENTLNQLLVEMDGFGTDTGVIIMAATNRPDVLDSALLRPGRFDRQISIDKPDLHGREEIFRVHLKPLKTARQVDPKKLSAQTPGFAGAEIANVCNEAALIAARRDKTEIDMQDFQDAIDRVIGGLEKKNKIISPEEKRIVAYHESGHAIAGWFFEHADPLVKVSIVPRGVAALGYAQYLPKEQYLYTTEQLLDGMSMTMGGRVAEDIVFGRISTGAQNDLERITKLAYAMVTIYGMNDKVGNISFNDQQNEYSFGKPYSEKTAELIDNEVRELISSVYQRTKTLLLEKRDGLEKLANELLKNEILFQSDLEEILGKRPFESHTTYDEFVNGAAAGTPPTELPENQPAENPASDEAPTNKQDEKPVLKE